MNLFYEEYPKVIVVDGQEIPIITDFREYIRLLDMLRDTELDPAEKYQIVCMYFLKQPEDFESAFGRLTEFVTMDMLREDAGGSVENERARKELYSFRIDYPFIFSAFLRDYDINLRTVPYLHWWEFRALFDGLSDDTEIKQRMKYRSIDASTIKDKTERKRIETIQKAIRLPSEKVMTDYDIGDALW